MSTALHTDCDHGSITEHRHAQPPAEIDFAAVCSGYLAVLHFVAVLVARSSRFATLFKSYLFSLMRFYFAEAIWTEKLVLACRSLVDIWTSEVEISV